ncbi:MAG TPA: ABC transporter permease, partial [Mucilaginibacter sp.]|nr:ABC transporter permease [Mucilaginibacter sp.]
MNPYTFHINLYDLAFLVTIPVGLTFALLLWFTQKANRGANRLLSLVLVTMMLYMARVLAIDIRLGAYFPHWSWLPLQFSLALGPLVYFYVLKITRPEYKFRRRDLLHFSPLLLELGVQGFEIGKGIKTGAATYDTLTFQELDPVLQLLAFISVLVYLYRCHMLIRGFYQQLKFNGGDRYRHELRWLHKLLTGFGLLWLLWIPVTAIDYFYYQYQLSSQTYFPLYLLLASTIIWIAARAFLRLEAGSLPGTASVLKPSLPAELKQKGIWLKKNVKANLYYQDPELSLSSLAEKLGLTTHELSRILNTVLKKSFNDFINEYRVADVIRKIQDTNYDHITLLGIALDSGFNSQSTFTRIFKQMTGKSPIEYKNDLKKDCPPYNLGSEARFATVISYHKTTHNWSYEKLNRNYMFRNYFKIAYRGFLKHKLFTLINVIGLSIGISAALVIYLIVHFDLTFDKFHKDGDRIYRVVTNFSFNGSPGNNAGVCGPLPWAAKNGVTGLQQVAPIFRLFQPNVVIPNGSKMSSRFKIHENVIVADGDYFKLFGYKWLAGSAATALNAPYQVVLTSEQAEKYFPGVRYEQMLGRTVVYDTLKTTVTGIVQTIKQNTDFIFNDFISFPTAFSNPSLKEQLRLNNWGGTSPEYQLFVKLAPQTTTAGIERQLNDIMKKNYKGRPGVTETFALQPLSDIHFNNLYGTFNGRVADKTTLLELSGIALFLLLLACINFINLTTAQSVQRAKEIGIRKTMGSTRKQLIFQFLSETFLISLVAVMISAAMAPVILKFFAGFVPAGVNANLFSQPGILLFLALLTIVVSLLSGFYPALVLSGYKTVSVLKNQSQNNSSKTRSGLLRKSLTVAQFGIAQFFIMATIMVSKQVYYAVHKDLGFKKDAILIVNSPWKNRQVRLNQLLLNKFRAIPQIELISMGRDAPAAGDLFSTEATYKDGKKEIKLENFGVRFGDENYIKVYHIKLLAGRNLMPGDTSKAVLINNTLAKQFGFKNPQDAVGKVISKYNGSADDMLIAGVVADFNAESMHAAIAPVAIMTSTNFYFNGTFHIALKPQTAGSDDWKTAISGMEKAWKQIYPEDDFEYSFFDESIAKLYFNEQNISALLSWATGLSILISCLGLLGLAIYTTTQRTKEIGVRKVLGATVAQIATLLSAELVWLIALSFLIISPVAWYA